MAEIIRAATVGAGRRSLSHGVSPALSAPSGISLASTMDARYLTEANEDAWAQKLEAEIAAGVAAEVTVLRADAERLGQAAGKTEGYTVGHAAGFEAGLVEGQESGRQEWEGLIGRFTALTETLALACKAGITDAQSLALEITHEAIARILGEQLARTEGVAAHVRDVCGRLELSSVLAVHLHPLDARRVETSSAQNSSVDLLMPPVKIVADPEITLGGCMVKTSRETIDARLETQLALLGEVINSARQSNGH